MRSCHSPSVLVVRLATVFLHQLVELIQELTDRVSADDSLAVRLRDAGLPHLELAVADNHLRVRDPERLKPQHLIRLLTEEPQRTPPHPCIARGHCRRSLDEI